MTITITAVPYIASNVITRRNTLLNPAAGASTAGVPANMTVTAGTNGAATLTLVDPADGNNPPPAGVPSTRLVNVTQTASATAGNTTVFIVSQQNTVTPGDTVRASMWVRSNEPRSMRVALEFTTASGTVLSYVNGPWVPTPSSPGTWYRFNVSGAAPATAARANLLVATEFPMLSGHRFRFTAPIVDPTTPPASDPPVYFEVGQPVAPGSFAAWTGTADASMSIVTSKNVFPDLATWATPDLVLDMPENRTAATTLHRVINKADPLPAFGPLSTRAGTLSLFAKTYADAVKLVQVHRAGKLVLLKDTANASRDMYYAPMTVSQVLASGSDDKLRWRVEVGYEEVLASAGLW